MKKFLVILSSVILASFSGCSEMPKSETSSVTVLSSATSEKSYRLKEISQPENDPLAVAPIGENGFIAAFGGIGEIPRFYIADSSFNFRSIDIPLDLGENDRVRLALSPCADGTAYAAVTISSSEDEKSFGGEKFVTLYHISAEGDVISSVPLSGIGDVEVGCICACDGKIYLSADTVYEIGDDGSGSPLSSLVYGRSLGVSSSGELCTEVYDGFDSVLKTGGRSVSLKSCGSPVSNIAGGGGYDAVFAVNSGIYAIEGDRLVSLAANISLGLGENSIREIYPVGDSFLISAFDEVSECRRLYLMTDEPEEMPHEQVTLKMGIFFKEDGFQSFLAQHNRSDSYVKIEPVYYDKYDDYDKSSDTQVSTALGQLNLDIISGNAPDIAVFMDTPKYLENKGTFADLYDIMDDELSRDAFLPNVLEAMENNGKLYSLPTTFRVHSMYCKSKFSPVEDQTFDDMLRTLENAPEGIAFTRLNNCNEVFTEMLSKSDLAADSSEGIFSVKTENIRRLMEFCDTLPKEWSEEINDIGRDEALFGTFSALCFGDFAQNYEMTGEPLTFTGYPSENGHGTTIDPVQTVAVFDSCEDKAAAWEFIKCMYSSATVTNGVNSGFPVIADKFEKLAKASEGSLTDEQAVQAAALVKSAHSLGSGADIDVFRIIWEEADVYFQGGCTAEQAAERIKNRTDIYASERG